VVALSSSQQQRIPGVVEMDVSKDMFAVLPGILE
jgi:hypothetical protein